MPDFNLTYPGFGGYGLEEDEEDRRRREMAAAQSQSIPMPQRPTMAALLPQPDPEMDARWRQAEQQALSRGGYGEEQSYGIGEGLRDFAPMAIGGVLDVLLNKGRGLGTLAAGGTQALSMERSRRDKAQGQQADYALRVRKEREGNAGMGIGAYHAALRGEELDLARSREQRMLQQQDPKVDAEMRAAELRRMNAMAAESEARAARDPNALTPYEQAQLEDRDLDRMDRAAARVERGEDRALARDAQADQRAYMAEQREAGRVEAQRNKFRDETERSRPQLTRAMETEEIVSRAPASRMDSMLGGDGRDIPGVGMWDSIKPGFMASPDDLAMRGNLTDMADLILRERSGAAAPPVEVQKLAANIAAGGGATEKEFTVLQAEYNKLLRSGLQQQAVGREDVAREVLGSRADWALGPRSAPQEGVSGPVTNGPTFRAGSGRAQAAGAQPMPGGRTDQLPVTDQKRGDVIRVDEYLQQLQQRTRTPGVRYRP